MQYTSYTTIAQAKVLSVDKVLVRLGFDGLLNSEFPEAPKALSEVLFGFRV